MKITIDQALGMFEAVKKVSYKEVKLDKISLIWLRLYPVMKEWDDAQIARNKDIEEARKPFTAEIEALKEEERAAKMPELDRKFREAVDALPSVQALPKLLKEEREVELPNLTEEECLAISKCSTFNTIGEVAPLACLIAK